VSSKYRDSREDKQLRFWFNSDMTCALLKQIDLSVGGLRGLEKCKLTLNYPITAIAGRNGAGKSTLLAMACCAFHAKSNQYRLPGRKHSYYTFSDFFFQHTNEVPPAGIEIYYQIAYNSWRKSADHPEGVGLAFQKRWRKIGTAIKARKIAAAAKDRESG